MLVFDHIPKTGGTTFSESYLSAAFSPEERLLIAGSGEAHKRDVERLFSMPAEQRQKLRVISGHYLEKLRLVEPNARYLSLVRDPVQRVLSSYRHVLREPTMEALARRRFGEEITLRDYAEHVHRPNAQAETLLGADYRKLTDDNAIVQRVSERFVIAGLTEDFVSFVFYLHIVANLPLCLFHNRNIGRDNLLQPTEEDLAVIRNKNRFDVRVYQIIHTMFYAKYNESLTSESRMLVDRFKARLEKYRERTREYPEDSPPRSICLRKAPTSWSARDDYEAVFCAEPPAWPNGVILQLMDWSTAYVEPGCSFSRLGKMWNLVTRPEKASNALAVRWLLEDQGRGKPVSLQLTLKVAEGQLGIYVADSENKAVLTPEVEIQPSERPVPVRVEIPGGLAQGILVFRNRSTSVSSATIVSGGFLERVDDPPAQLVCQGNLNPASATDDVIPLWKVEPRSGGMISVRRGAIVLTSGSAQWSYAASLQLAFPENKNSDFIVSIEIKTEQGTMGIGWLNADSSAWITRTSVGPTADFVQVRLVVPSGTAGGSLVFDNWTEGGRPASAVIQEISVG